MGHARCLATTSAVLFLAAVLAPVVLVGVALAGGVAISSTGGGVGFLEGTAMVLVRQLVLSEAGLVAWLVLLLTSVAGMAVGASRLREDRRDDR